MNRRDFVSTPETETRLLLLIDGFSRKLGGGERLLEGRTKLAKLDFFLRYPHYLALALAQVAPAKATAQYGPPSIADRMVRYRYGPWDPQYFAALGSLLGRELIIALPTSRGFGYRTTSKGAATVQQLLEDDAFTALAEQVSVLRKEFDWTGNKLNDFVYGLIPELSETPWNVEVT